MSTSWQTPVAELSWLVDTSWLISILVGSVVLNMNSGGVNTDVVLGCILHANNQACISPPLQGGGQAPSLVLAKEINSETMETELDLQAKGKYQEMILRIFSAGIVAWKSQVQIVFFPPLKVGDKCDSVPSGST